MPSLKTLQRAVWALLGVGGLCVVVAVITPSDRIDWIRFGPAKHETLPIPAIVGITCALLAGVVAMVAVFVSFFTPRDQQEKTEGR